MAAPPSALPERSGVINKGEFYMQPFPRCHTGGTCTRLTPRAPTLLRIFAERFDDKADELCDDDKLDSHKKARIFRRCL